MKPAELLNTAKEAITVRRVFGEPVEKDGVMILPGATVSGGGGGGGGHDEQGQEGEGGGFGVRARPAGAFVLSGGEVRWRPAIDLNRVLTIAAAVAVASLFAWVRVRLADR
jgi:uncharacterized spore protein YtfJ